MALGTESSPRRMPIHICCAVDVSGSMGTEIKLTASESSSEQSHGFNRLDLVKHALYTILASLRNGDMFSLVKFTDVASCVFQKLEITSANRIIAKEKIKSLEPLNGTNIWGGITAGLDILSSTKNNKKVNALFLLTDGVPSVDSPRGYEYEFANYDRKNANSNFIINTFGFGYELNSVLLEQIATFGRGTYSFIPDGSFVRTIFINALANIFRTVAIRASCQITYDDGSLSGNFTLNSVLFEQERIHATPKIPNKTPIKITFTYSDVATSTFSTIEHQIDGFPTHNETLERIAIENSTRLLFVTVLKKCLSRKMVSI